MLKADNIVIYIYLLLFIFIQYTQGIVNIPKILYYYDTYCIKDYIITFSLC